jgi:putative ABC transport system permease protein
MTLEAVFHELRVAWRGLARTKSFGGAAVLLLALGIAGTTVMFALIQGVLLRPLPVQDPDSLIVAWKELRTSGSARYPFGDSEIESVARASQLLEKAAGVTRNGVGRSVLTDSGVSTYAHVALVTGRFFEVLGVEAIVGRTLAAADEKPGAENVIVISSGLWLRQYGGSGDVVGRRVRLGEQPFTIAGVIPPDLDYPSGVEIWQTTSSVPMSEPFAEAARREVNLIGRLRRGVTRAQASDEMLALTRRLEIDAPADALRGLTPVVRSFTDAVVGDVRTAMLALFGAVGLVLLIAVATVANLLMLRGEARGGELAVRAALGAGPGRLVREVLAETLVLAMIAGAAGIAFAWWTLGTLIRLVPDGLPRVESIRIDATVISFSIGIVFAVALVAGLAPALMSMRTDLVSRLRREGHGVTDVAVARGRRTLVVAQVALAVTIVAAAGLLMRSVLRLQSVDLGLPADRLVLLELHIPQTKYADSAQHAQFLDSAIAQLEAVPIIRSATPVNVPPFSGQGWDLPRFTSEGQSAEEAAANPSLNLESIHPNYFKTFEVPIVRGRAFTEADREGATPVAIVSDDLAARIWPGQDPIGKRLKMGDFRSAGPWSHTVVGIAARTRYRTVASPQPTLYLPAAQFQMTATMLVVRTSASLELLASVARDAIRNIDSNVHVMRVATFGDLLDRPLARPRFNASILAIFGSAALLFCMVGLYSVMAAYVGQRDREIALRLALGATAAGVRRFVLAEALRLTGLGVVIGVLGASIAARLVQDMLFELDPHDPLTLTAATLLLLACSAAACYVPLRRATRVEAAIMLRS